ncbi:ABC transporter permease [Bordetella sp. N]|uniref:ABC transporter permease n=1 Tax=Bordetella sp. N TaxID=1746199 RepID=UPI00070996B3|nr:ABC transporter permease [Bordetella sp. N]ALM84082.1 ABC transporter [Bordetella sp. N]
MWAYLIRRLGHVLFVVAAMAVLIFLITQAMPGNVAYTIAGHFATPQQVAAIEARLGLNDPLWTQFWRWAGGALRGDMGQSLVMGRPVGPLISEALGRSALLAVSALVLTAVVGILLGVVAAVSHGRWPDRAVLAFSWLSISLPQFLIAILLVLVVAGTLGWLPATGYAPLSAGLGNWAAHLIMPVGTLVLGLVAHVASLQRSSMLEALNAPYVRAARAKGLKERTVLYRHALRNALIPTVTVLALDFGILMGGIVVVETVFSYPGLGRLLIFAVEQKDLPILQAGVLAVTVIYALANLAADIAYAFLDPRIRYGNLDVR